MNALRGIFYFLLATSSHSGIAQLQVDTTKSVEYLVQEILAGQGVLIGNITFHGAPYAMSLFNDKSEQVGLSEGILLSTGNVYYSLGPNKSPRSGWASNTSGDEDLNRITKGQTYDAAVLEFDFITQSENLIFNYVFASEEYQEYVGSKFNDVFGFFLSGPNADHVNLATLPDAKTPITINNVNHERGQDYYVDNPYYNNSDPFIWDVRKRKVVKNKKYMKKADPPKYNVQFDGFTVVLTAQYNVIPNEVYHIKLAVADVSDGILDSGVFLKAGSFRSEGNTITEIDRVIETNPVVPLVQKVELVVASTAEEKPPALEHSYMNWNHSDLRVEFEFDSYDVPDSSYYIIENVYQILNHDETLCVEAVGHTDNMGSNTYNIALSQQRSQAVIEYLVLLGVTEDRITSLFYGESQPIGTNHTDEGRARNRRVEFQIKPMEQIN